MRDVETELRLGLPGGEMKGEKGSGKRVFSETVSSSGEKMKSLPGEPSRYETVGWPPVRSFRKNVLSSHASKGGETKEEDDDVAARQPSIPVAGLVKVRMDGAAYMRKVNLRSYGTYEELSSALQRLFGYSNCAESSRSDVSPNQWKKRMDFLKGDYVATYEDKDGDWMLVGDVPWEMFISSCKRLRIMRSSEAVGL